MRAAFSWLVSLALALAIITIGPHALAQDAGTALAEEAAKKGRISFHVQSQTVGDAYQLVTSDNELLNRRRLHQYVGLSAYDLLQDGEGQVSLVTLFRFDADFGLTEDELDSVQGLRRDRLSIQAAYVEGRDLFGMLDVRFGRQLHADPIDFMMLDGLVATARLPWHLGIELLAGVEADNDIGSLTSSQAELDGTRVLEENIHGVDVATDRQKVALGASLVTHGLWKTRGRVGYRRLFSDGKVNQEKVAGAIYQRVGDRLHLDAASSYDFYNGRFDTVRAGSRWTATDAWDVEAQYVRLLPSFDAESIFNIFTAYALNDVNARVRYHFRGDAYLYAGGMLRLFGNDGPPDLDDPEEPLLWTEDPESPIDEGVKAFGGMLGYYRGFAEKGWVSLDVSHEDGFGGTRTLVDLGGAWAVAPGVVRLDGRVTGVSFEDSLQANLHGFGAGYQLGASYLIDRRAALRLLVEHNFNRNQTSQLRAFVVADLDLWK